METAGIFTIHTIYKTQKLWLNMHYCGVILGKSEVEELSFPQKVKRVNLPRNIVSFTQQLL